MDTGKSDCQMLDEKAMSDDRILWQVYFKRIISRASIYRCSDTFASFILSEC